MRGFRFLGPVTTLSSRDYLEDDLLFFSPSQEGGDWRTGCIRARNFDLFQCQTFVSIGACPSDFVFAATAIGEEAFK